VYVCHCRAVTDTTIRTTIECGAEDVTDVGSMCGAGTNCGGCIAEIEKLCASMRERLTPTQLAS
jgi:bacterioferritin-associated ferredoxin